MSFSFDPVREPCPNQWDMCVEWSWQVYQHMDLFKALVRELSFGHVCAEGFNMNLSESPGLKPWDLCVCVELACLNRKWSSGMHLSGSF